MPFYYFANMHLHCHQHMLHGKHILFRFLFTIFLHTAPAMFVAWLPARKRKSRTSFTYALLPPVSMSHKHTHLCIPHPHCSAPQVKFKKPSLQTILMSLLVLLQYVMQTWHWNLDIQVHM